LKIGDLEKASVELNPDTVASYDVVVVTTNHSAFDYEMIGHSAQLIFDARNAFQGNSGNVVKL
jgi:UDP-N-acetyl-D-glucosamine dehydrogenase